MANNALFDYQSFLVHLHSGSHKSQTMLYARQYSTLAIALCLCLALKMEFDCCQVKGESFWAVMDHMSRHMLGPSLAVKTSRDELNFTKDLEGTPLILPVAGSEPQVGA